jgi:hypothetical protein
MHSITRKTMSAAGIALVGDAFVHAIGGRKHLQIWSFKRAPAVYRGLIEALGANLRLLYGLSVAEILVGAGLVSLARKGL